MATRAASARRRGAARIGGAPALWRTLLSLA